MKSSIKWVFFHQIILTQGPLFKVLSATSQSLLADGVWKVLLQSVSKMNVLILTEFGLIFVLADEHQGLWLKAPQKAGNWTLG